MITQFPTSPSRNDEPDVFVTRADAFLGHFPTFVGEINPEIVNINTKAAQVNEDTDTVVNAKTAAVAAANFKGAWGDLTGPLSIPASVAHDGVVWVLLEDVADVTAAEPGASAEWLGIPDIASDADLHAGTSGKWVGASGIYSANAPVTSSGSGAWSPDFEGGRNFARTITGNSTLGNPANQKPGQAGLIIIKQDATGDHTLSFASDWVLPPLAVVASDPERASVLTYYVADVGEIYLGITEDLA